ncbi:MAG: DUF4956 domain-containing protein [Saprospiraceae bacterium]|nr:DUF4956 domain-containing protein [Saprospiraceae bacterium]
MDSTAVIDSILNSSQYFNFTPGNLQDFIFRFILNIVSVIILVRFIYYPRHRNKDYVFTYFVFNCLIFLVCYLLNNAKMMFGVAFGLFAIFSILRYRTVSIPIREMGYFFTCVTLGIINSMTNYQEHFYEILFSNIIAILLIIILDKFFSVERENFQIMVYDKLELIKPENKTLLIEDIRNRTGLPVINTKIEHIDLSKNLCRLKVYFSIDSKEIDSLESTQDDDDD